MVFNGFLDRPQQHINVIKLVYWNVNGAKTKLEKKCVQDLVMKYEIVCLNEVVCFASVPPWLYLL